VSKQVPQFWLAQAGDAGLVARCLAALAEELGDGAVFASTPEAIAAGGFGPRPLFHCLLSGPRSEPQSLALFFPHFSTTRGCAGAYIQDLWVAEAQRSQGLGQALLAAVKGYAEQQWQARYLALSVHTSNPKALAFYHRLGFEAGTGMQPLALTGAAFQSLTNSKGSPA
jgi:GNAT superfamily N-acetyltransferase